MKQRKNSWYKKIRLIVQILFLVIVVAGASSRNLDLPVASEILPEIQGLCPFGAVQTITKIFTHPDAVFRPDRSSLWVLGGIVLATILFGPLFCSFVCPFGTLQEWMGKLGKRLFKKRYNTLIPPRLVKILGFMRYGVLLFVLLVGFGIIGFSLDLINPSYAMVHVWTSIIPVSALVVLASILVLSLFIERPWCKFFCPLGAFQGLLSKMSLFKIKRDPSLCRDCSLCDRACPMAIQVSQTKQVTDTHCNRCLKCVEACPRTGALKQRAGTI
jgi:polyferredoxin